MKRQLKPSTVIIPSPVVLLSVHGENCSNIITVSWIANVCSNPPMVAVGIRPNRYSHALAAAARDFVINIPSSTQLEAAVYCGTKSGRDHDKFKECSFTEVPATKVSSPLIAECPINVECKVTRILPLGVHNLFIAEVVAVHMDDEVLTDDGRFKVAKAKPLTYFPPSGEYWSIGEKLR